MHRFVILSLASLAALFTAVGCTSAGLCTRGEVGCACTLEDECGSGARCNGDGMCIESDEPEPRPDGGNEPDPPAPDASDCSDDSLMGACRDFCEAFCQNQIRFCLGSACLPGDCEADGELLNVCLGGCNTPNCAHSLCEDQSEIACPAFGFPSETNPDVRASACFESDPVCVPEGGCSDVCGSLRNGTGGDLADNGRCEDGGEGSVDATCPRGTDCTDCGSRSCAAPGDECDNHGDCCGFFDDRAFCVRISAGQSQCLPSCERARDCPAGRDCVELDASASVCAP